MFRGQAAGIVKHFELVKAFAEGANIQFYDCGEWQDVDSPVFDQTVKYRIKPKEYRPLTINEAFNLMMANMIIYNQNKKGRWTISSVYKNESVQLSDNYNATHHVTLKRLCEQYTHVDGTPLGKVIE